MSSWINVCPARLASCPFVQQGYLLHPFCLVGMVISTMPAQVFPFALVFINLRKFLRGILKLWTCAHLPTPSVTSPPSASLPLLLKALAALPTTGKSACSPKVRRFSPPFGIYPWKILEDVARNRTMGPFPRCPFPNSGCESQGRQISLSTRPMDNTWDLLQSASEYVRAFQCTSPRR